MVYEGRPWGKVGTSFWPYGRGFGIQAATDGQFEPDFSLSGHTSPSAISSLRRSGWHRGGSMQSIYQPQDFLKQIAGHGDFRHRERNIATMADNLGSDLE